MTDELIDAPDAWGESYGADGFLEPSRLSFSSLSVLAECGEKWRLQRGYKVEDRSTYWATLAGTCIHQLSEIADEGSRQGDPVLGQDNLNMLTETFGILMDNLEVEAIQAGLVINATGKQTVSESFSGGPNKRDKDWWLHYGPQYVQAYAVWREQQDTAIIATELEFEVTVAGETLIGAIDRVERDNQTGLIGVRDVKSGSHMPGGPLQLAIYSVALEETLGFRADFGDYITFRAKKEICQATDPKTGLPAVITRGKNKGEPKMDTVETGVEAYDCARTDFTGMGRDYVESALRQARQTIQQGLFLPNLRGNCFYCPVRRYCRATGGPDALMFPVASVVERRRVEEPAGDLVS